MFAKVLAHLRRQYAGFLALFIVLGGTSYAVATGSIDSREIKNNTIRSKDIRNGQIRGHDIRRGAVTSSHLKNGSLRRVEFRPGELPAGPPGPPGLSGLVRVEQRKEADSSSPQTVTARCPAGKKVVGAGFRFIEHHQ